MRRIKRGKRHERGETKKKHREGSADDKGWMTVQTHADEVRERLDCDEPARGQINEIS